MSKERPKGKTQVPAARVVERAAEAVEHIEPVKCPEDFDAVMRAMEEADRAGHEAEDAVARTGWPCPDEPPPGECSEGESYGCDESSPARHHRTESEESH